MVAAAALALVILLGVACGGGPAPGEGFAIYLPAGDVSLAQLDALSSIEIADTPLVSGADIVTYSADTHEIELTPAAYEKIVTLEGWPSFVVCVDGRPIYSGAFWTIMRSSTFDGVVIIKPFSSEAAPNHCVLRLELGYPGRDWFNGEDPRADPRVLDALERAGKLR